MVQIIPYYCFCVQKVSTTPKAQWNYWQTLLYILKLTCKICPFRRDSQIKYGFLCLSSSFIKKNDTLKNSIVHTGSFRYFTLDSHAINNCQLQGCGVWNLESMESQLEFSAQFWGSNTSCYRFLKPNFALSAPHMVWPTLAEMGKLNLGCQRKP